MGNLPAKRGLNQTPSTVPILDDSIKKKIDPFSIFDIADYSKEDIVLFLESPEFKKKYRTLMLRNHPDRGGSVLKCSIIQYAYEKLQ